MGISNTLETAIQNYSKNNKSSDTWTNLVSQTAAAKADLTSIASFKQEQQAIITAFPEKLQTLQTEVENLKQEKIEAGKAVDANREGIQLNIRKNAIETKEIPAKEKAFSDSQIKVSNAEKKLTEDLAGQDGIIKDEQICDFTYDNKNKECTLYPIVPVFDFLSYNCIDIAKVILLKQGL